MSRWQVTPSFAMKAATQRKAMTMTEREWARLLAQKLQAALESSGVRVEDGKRLLYAHEILTYAPDGPGETSAAGYETDLLIFDEVKVGHWVPRVVIECKLGGVTTHDALTYSSKASSHKQVHPYLRYGILVGGLGSSLPPRLARHGQFFDFMGVWHGAEADEREWKDLLDVLRAEIAASRQLQSLLCDRKWSRATFTMLHRPLVLIGREIVPPAPELPDEEERLAPHEDLPPASLSANPEECLPDQVIPITTAPRAQTGDGDSDGGNSHYYVYENWVHGYAKIHLGNCTFCNRGKGLHRNRTDDNSQWHGPFRTLEAAVAAADGTMLAVEVCRATGPCSSIPESSGDPVATA